jgi:predicted Fe-Mo cluster-binding NifX family protein
MQRTSPSQDIPRQRAAVPSFMGRVSPVLDTCTQLCLLDPKGQGAVACWTIPVHGASLYQRVFEIRQLGIGLIICGAVSELFETLLREAEVRLIPGIAGDLDDVITAYCSGTLNDPRFRMPGSD